MLAPVIRVREHCRSHQAAPSRSEESDIRTDDSPHDAVSPPGPRRAAPPVRIRVEDTERGEHAYLYVCPCKCEAVYLYTFGLAEPVFLHDVIPHTRGLVLWSTPKGTRLYLSRGVNISIGRVRTRSRMRIFKGHRGPPTPSDNVCIPRSVLATRARQWARLFAWAFLALEPGHSYWRNRSWPGLFLRPSAVNLYLDADFTPSFSPQRRAIGPAPRPEDQHS